MIRYTGRQAAGPAPHFPTFIEPRIVVAELRVWYRTPGGDPQLESIDVQIKGVGSRADLIARLREIIPPRCRLVRWELLG